MTKFPEKSEFLILLTRELEACDAPVRKAASELLTEPVEKTLKWEYGHDEEYQAWVFADFRERGVRAAYCLGGHGALGSPWGLVFMHSEYFGQDGGWYDTLEDLLSDWGLGREA